MTTSVHAIAQASPAPRAGLLLRKWPVAVILSSFFVITIPLCLLDIMVDRESGWSIGVAYFAVFGISHFLLTFTVYCQSANLRHFCSSRTRMVGYFLLPLLIFLAFDLYRALEVAILWPVVDFGVRIVIRLVDFQHSARQSYGVLQLFKSRASGYFWWQRSVENHYFSTMTLLMFVTALSGGRFSDHPVSLIVTTVGVLLGSAALCGHMATCLRSSGRSLVPVGYFCLQSACLWMSAYRTELYACALAMHYVEYHLLMAPRCFQTQLDPTSRVDRIFGMARTHKVFAYGLLLLTAGIITHFTWLGMGTAASASVSGPLGFRMLVSLFDGLFVFHYVVDTMIWKFSVPYYRQTLVPLYFGADPRPSKEAPSDERQDPVCAPCAA